MLNGNKAPLERAARILMDTFACPLELTCFLSNGIYFMHYFSMPPRGTDNNDDHIFRAMAGEPTSELYAALQLIENFIPSWYANDGEEPSEAMIEDIVELLDYGHVELWESMIEKLRYATTYEISQGCNSLRVSNLLAYQSAFEATIPLCEQFMAEVKPMPTAKAA